MSSPGLDLLAKEKDGGRGGLQWAERLPSDFDVLGLVRGETVEGLDVGPLLSLVSSITVGGRLVLVRPDGGVFVLIMDVVEYLLLKLGTLKLGAGDGCCLSEALVLGKSFV